jgi:hypothetical protein
VAALALAIDFVHALAIFLWVVGLPLLVWHRWPRLSRAYAIYAVAFVVVNLGSRWLLGECILSTVARWVWVEGQPPPDYGEWFTVRFSRAVFGASPSHGDIVVATKALIFVTALGVLVSLRKSRGRLSAPDPRSRRAATVRHAR